MNKTIIMKIFSSDNSNIAYIKTPLSIWVVRGFAFKIRAHSSSDWTKIQTASL